jgi:pimeloyl-ACP methyl ester carboxylesterase
MSKDYTLHTSDKEKLQITAYGENNLSSKKFLIFVHGFKGFKDWGFGPFLANYFADKGFFVITFNFSHNGIGKEKLEFTELDKFAANTYSREVDELSELIDAVKSGFFEGVIPEKIGLIGHSRGGAISLLTASKKDKVDALVTWSAVSKLDRYSERQKAEWKRLGHFEALNSRTNQMMRMNYSFLEDLEINKDEKLNLEKAVNNLNQPLLIAHGDQDLAVPKKEADQLYEWSNKERTELFILNNTGHTFDIKHPFEGSSEKFNKLLNATNIFFQKQLN